MFFDWNGRPALMMPTLGYCVQRPGTGWTRASADRIGAEAEPLDDQEFWRRFAGWRLQDFPVAFSALDRPARHASRSESDDFETISHGRH